MVITNILTAIVRFSIYILSFITHTKKNSKGVHWAQHRRQGLPHATVLLKMIIVQQKNPSLGRNCLKNTGRNFIRNLEKTKHL